MARVEEPPDPLTAMGLPAGNTFEALPSSGPPAVTPSAGLPGARPGQSAFPGLLADLPDLHEPPPPAPHRGEAHPEAIARKYERALEARLQATADERSFLQRRGLLLATGGLAVAVAAGLGGSFLYTRVRNQGLTLDAALQKALTAFHADTREQYSAAVAVLDQALEMDESNAQARAYKALAHAILYADHGRAEADRQAAREALANPQVRTAQPDVTLVAEVLTAEGATAAAARQQLLGKKDGASVLQAEAGRILLADRKLDEALARLKAAVEAEPRNVRALSAIGEYYLAQKDPEAAAAVLGGTTAELSRFHVGRVLGLTEARLALGRELASAAADMESLEGNTTLPPALEGRAAWLKGRALSAAGRHDEARATLEKGKERFPALQQAFTLALAESAAAGGRMAPAQELFESVRAEAPTDEAATEGLGRVLLARSRERELLDKLKADGPLAARVALLRGIAWARLGEAKKARAELSRTEVAGKVPAEAAVYLALLDAQEERGDKAVALLETLAANTRRHKATAQVALARLYLSRKDVARARPVLQEAAQDGSDFEASALLGEVLLREGNLEGALGHFLRAVERNQSHAPGQHGLVQVLLGQGKWAQALQQALAFTADNPALPLAWADAAQAHWQSGQLPQAEAALARGIPPASEDVAQLRVRSGILFSRGDGKGAFAALERANRLDVKDGDTFCAIGDAFVRQGVAETALKAYEAAAKLQATSWCAAYGRGAAPLLASPRRGRAPGAAVLTGWVKDAPTAWQRGQAQALLALALLDGRNAKGAAEAAEEAVTTAPGLAQAWYASAEVARRSKDEARAEEALAKAVGLDASWATPRLSLADTWARRGGDLLPRALEAYQAVLPLTQNEADRARVTKAVATLKRQLR